MKKFILAFIILLIPCIFAQSIEVDYPKEVQIGEEFIFELKLIDFIEDNYDVKIDILNEEKRIAKILNNGEWKSTYYYISDAISNNQEQEFSMKILDYEGEGEIMIKIRNSLGRTEVFEGYEIKIDEDIIDEQFSEKNETKINETTENNKTNTTPFPKEQEIIKLNPKDIKTDDDNKKTRSYAIIGFVVFCVLLALLFIIQKIKSNKNEFR